MGWTDWIQPLQALWPQVVPHLLWGGVALALVLSTLAVVAAWFKNAGVVDLMWGAGLVGMSAYLAWMGEGDDLRRLLIAGMMGLANLRLTFHLVRRFLKEFPEEDARYHYWRKEWGEPKAHWLFWGVFLWQGALIVWLTAPVAVVAANPASSIAGLEWLAVGLFILSGVGELVADEQLARFKANPDNQGQVCDVGLWYTSRHPNYFFQWMLWISYAIFAWASPGGWVAILQPVTMFLFLFYVTGIPPTEQRALETKSEAYRRYQETTSVFVPWFKQTSHPTPSS